MRANRWRAVNYDEQERAHWTFSNAVTAGKIKRAERCSRCEKGGRIHAHHEDYAKPLDVVWLCPRCHELAHSVMARAWAARSKAAESEFARWRALAEGDPWMQKFVDAFDSGDVNLMRKRMPRWMFAEFEPYFSGATK